MATRYQRITALQEPFDLGADAVSRNRIGFNIYAQKDVSSTFEEELVKILELANVGTFNRTIFIGATATIPGGAPGALPKAQLVPTIHITPTGGSSPELTHNSASPQYSRRTAQVLVRGSDYVAARNLAQSAFDALTVVRNTTVTL